MSITQDNPVVWDRKTTTGTDARGHPQTASAPGFPVDALGTWQPKNTSTQKGEGRESKTDAVFISDSFLIGQVNDIATIGGTAFRCTSADVRTGMVSGHARYEFARVG